MPGTPLMCKLIHNHMLENDAYFRIEMLQNKVFIACFCRKTNLNHTSFKKLIGSAQPVDMQFYRKKQIPKKI